MKRPSRLRTKSLAPPAALGTAAAILLIPANVLPVISTNTLGRVRTDTILSGIEGLWREGFWAIAVIVFVASVLIPILKLAGLGFLLWAVRRGPSREARRWTKVYVLLDFVGRWSMLDVFLVAFLAGLVRFGLLSTVEPGPGIVAFAGAVVLTVLAMRTFEPRLLWSPVSLRIPSA